MLGGLSLQGLGCAVSGVKGLGFRILGVSGLCLRGRLFTYVCISDMWVSRGMHGL